VIVYGPRVSLRYPVAADVSALFELGQDPGVTRFFSWGPYTDESQPSEFIRRVTAQREAGERLEFAIADRDDQLIGITGLSDFSLRDRRATVGTWLGRPHWGTGINAESKALILRLAFDRLGLLRATALASPDNLRSLAALERLGFTREGVLRGWHIHGAEQRDVEILRLMREDFENGALAGVPMDFEGHAPEAFYSQRK
jgi:ribosomal-protein-alanine N-acetyltransferase